MRLETQTADLEILFSQMQISCLHDLSRPGAHGPASTDGG